MSSDNIAIRVQNLSKCYQIYERPGDRLKQFVFPRIKRVLGKKALPYFREFWANENLSFDVKCGETVGIIGRNGSGKSTLLQLISGTLTPTSGSVQINGKIAALLELGSGFNPEFTGRENIYLNASVLGLTQEEISERFQKIVDFADIGEFIEQPVKTYSSGMYVKLAFAVIAHVDADILIVDEALAVGDAVFVQKCMRFIRDFQKRGTLLFVSHDTASVQNLCESAIWLDKGKIRKVGTSKEVSESYLQYTLQEVYGKDAILSPSTLKEDSSNVSDFTADTPTTTTGEEKQPPVISYNSEFNFQDNLEEAKGWRSNVAEIISIEILKLNKSDSVVYEGGESVRLVIKARAIEELKSPILGFVFKDRLGQDLFGENTLPFTHLKPCTISAGETFIGEFEFNLPMLPNGQFAVMASVADGDLYKNIQHHYAHDALIVNVSSSRVRWGLVGIPFQKVSLKVIHG